jgi:hypothetical protein
LLLARLNKRRSPALTAQSTKELLMGGCSPNQDGRQADGRDAKGVAGQKTPAQTGKKPAGQTGKKNPPPPH